MAKLGSTAKAMKAAEKKIDKSKLPGKDEATAKYILLVRKFVGQLENGEVSAASIVFIDNYGTQSLSLGEDASSVKVALALLKLADGMLKEAMAKSKEWRKK